MSDASPMRLSSSNPLASLGLANTAYVEDETEEPLVVKNAAIVFVHIGAEELSGLLESIGD